ncbi:hypothetical protein [Variovorax sp. V213]|uniref:hypothetical protein n=1 Tax=Variovorax sp. V213 TaxID=3065955 RepID=UPI0034E8BFCE
MTKQVSLFTMTILSEMWRWSPGTPEAVVKKLSQDFADVVRSKDFAEKNLIQVGLTPVGSSPEELRQRIARDVTAVAEFVRSAGIKPE